MTKIMIFLINFQLFQSIIIRAIDLWLNMSFTVSSELLLRVAFHQLSNTTPSVGHSSPSDRIRRVLSGVKMEILRPVPHCSSTVSVTGMMVSWSEMMSNVIPLASRS